MPIVGYRLNGDNEWDHFVGALGLDESREELVPGTYVPGPATTGPVSTALMETVTGDVTYNAANQVIQGKDIHGSIFIGTGGSNLVFRNCIIRGNGSDDAVNGASFNLRGATFYDCRFDMTGNENVFRNNISGGNFKLLRCELTRGVDGIGLVSPVGNVDILGGWVHNGAVFEWAPGTPNVPGFSDNRTHNDGIQIQVGANYNIVGNMIGGLRKNYVKNSGQTSIPDSADDFDNSGVLLQQEGDNSAGNKLKNIQIKDNWFWGGAASLNIGYKFGNALDDNVVISGNRFMRRIPTGGGFYVYKNTSTNPTMSGNVFDDDNSAVTVNTYS